MNRRTLAMTDDLQGYLDGIQRPFSSLEQRLVDETATLSGANMQIALEQARFMSLLTQLIGARRCLEIGTFTGLSALAVASSLPEDGELITMDINTESTAIAQRYWAEAGVAGKISLRLGPALDTLATLRQAGEEASFDMAFIDADKANYPTYYAACLALIRPGGVLLVDNVLWSGRVADPDNQSKDTEGIRALNRLVRDDPQVDHCVIPLADGLSIIRRRPAA